jgi:hypothetical protein
MTLLQPPSYCESAQCYTPQQDRLLWSSIICQEGIQNGFAITPGGGMSVNIAAGAGFIQGDTQANEGMYWVTSTAVENRVLAPADPTDPRVDLIAARINANCTWELVIITGTPAPVPVLPALPPTAIQLGTITVTAGLVTVTAGNIFSYGPPAQMCAGLLPTPGWKVIAQGYQAGGTLSPAFPVPNSPNGGPPRNIRGVLTYEIDTLGDIGLRINAVSTGNYQSGYRSWDTAGALSQNRGALTDTWSHVGYSGDNHSGTMEFAMAAQFLHECQISSRFSTVGPTLADMRSGLGEGRVALSQGTVTSVQIATTATAFADLTWTIEASYEV